MCNKVFAVSLVRGVRGVGKPAAKNYPRTPASIGGRKAARTTRYNLHRWIFSTPNPSRQVTASFPSLVRFIPAKPHRVPTSRGPAPTYALPVAQAVSHPASHSRCEVDGDTTGADDASRVRRFTKWWECEACPPAAGWLVACVEATGVTFAEKSRCGVEGKFSSHRFVGGYDSGGRVEAVGEGCCRGACGGAVRNRRAARQRSAPPADNLVRVPGCFVGGVWRPWVSG